MNHPTRYPLQWPPGWKRHPSRTEANFSKYGKRLSVCDGVQRVLVELGRLGVKEADVVISSNLQTRLDGMPRSDQANPGDPGVCVYWQRGKQPMQCMAVDRYFKVADNLAAVAASLEALRAIERHGGAVVLERAFAGFAALPAPIVAGMTKPWRKVLGFPELAEVSSDMVHARHRNLVQEHHPDRGPDHERDARTRRTAEINAARDHALKELS